MVKVDMVSVGMDKKINAYVVLLQAGQEMRALPIFTGAFEAGAISTAIERLRSPRPLVHDLLKTVVEGLAGKVERVEILGMEADYYVACVDLVTHEGKHIRIDARPSDAVALALRSSAPIFIADEVIARSGVFLKQGDGAQPAETAEAGGEKARKGEKGKRGPRMADSPIRRFGGERGETDRLQARLRWLVREEAYEAAAGVRDLIRDAGQVKSEEKNHQKCIDMS